LVGSYKLLKRAKEGGYAVGAFNAENMEMVQAIVEAAEELDAPVIIQTALSTPHCASAELFYGMVNAEAAKAHVPVALHLDHGSGFDLCAIAIRAGYTSVMIDGSSLSFEENVDVCRRVAELCNVFGVSVEAGLKTVDRREESSRPVEGGCVYTNYDTVGEFVERTGIQVLEVDAEALRGLCEGVEDSALAHLREIGDKVGIPLAIRDVSGVPDEALRKVISCGASKVDFTGKVREAYLQGAREALAGCVDCSGFQMFQRESRERVRQLVKEKILLCGSGYRAYDEF